MKNKLWIFFNLGLLLLFISFYLGLDLVASSNNIFMLPLIYYFGIPLVLLNYFFPIINIIGFIYHWKKYTFKSAITMYLIFLAIFYLTSFLLFYLIPMIREDTRFKEETRQLQEKSLIDELERKKKLNSENNYDLISCSDSLEDGVISLECSINVKISGPYNINGKLEHNDAKITGYDETIMKSAREKYYLSENSSFKIKFDYRHIASKYDVPDGPYVIILRVVPTEYLSEELNFHTFSGYENVYDWANYTYKDFLRTKYYSGKMFEKLPRSEIY